MKTSIDTKSIHWRLSKQQRSYYGGEFIISLTYHIIPWLYIRCRTFSAILNSPYSGCERGSYVNLFSMQKKKKKINTFSNMHQYASYKK